MNGVNVESSTIFVSIAAYRDSETRNTINDLFAKAKHKHRVFVGVFSQLHPEHDNAFRIGGRTNVREMSVDSRTSKGCTWARHLILKRLRKDEDFVLQIDAHSRFDQNWDETILKEFAKLPHAKCVLTSYPPGFDVHKPLETSPKFVYMKFRDIHPSGLPYFLSDVSLHPNKEGQPRITPALSAGCLFGPSAVFNEVQYDPYVYFFGEEQSYAIRLYTHGVDSYVPSRTFMYHLYYNPSKDVKNLHWVDKNKEAVKDQTLDGVGRVKYLLGMTDVYPDNNKDLDLYGLGKVRSVAQWQSFSGFNLLTGELMDVAKKGNYHDYPVT